MQTDLINEAIQAFDLALAVRTREHLPQDWAATQLNLGNAWLSVATHTVCGEAVRPLTDAIDSYRHALTIYTREQFPQPWALTQSNLGNALLRQFECVQGADASRTFAETLEAYRQALTVYTREQLPQHWAMVQSNLGLAFLRQLERAQGSDNISLFTKTVQAYRLSLDVYTYENTPQQWAKTHNNIGMAMRTHAQQLGGEIGARLLREAVAVFELALQVRRRETLPQDWLQTQVNLAQVRYLLGDWEKAALAYANALSMMPGYVQGLELLSDIYERRLFRFTEAFALNEQRANLNPGNLAAESDWAETHFTTARFAEAESRLAVLIANPKLDASTQTALRALEIANALALGKAESVKPKLAALITAVAQQPADFHVGWSFNGTLHFIGTHEPLAARRDWLRQLIAAVQAENRDAILTGLRAAQKQFKP